MFNQIIEKSSSRGGRREEEGEGRREALATLPKSLNPTQLFSQKGEILIKEKKMRALEESRSFIVLLLLLLFSSFITLSLQANELSTSSEEVGEMRRMVPLMEEKFMVMNETRRKLGSFQICSVCTCCGGAKGLCLPSPCCYAINCNIPNRPFGYCSFTPKTCNCFGCHI